MRDNYPPAVVRFLDAFSKHAQRLVADDPSGRNADTVARIAEQVFAPWDHDQQKPHESRQTTFLRDYFNVFWEAVLACDHLETIRDLLSDTLPVVPPQRKVKILVYWSEAYLNEVYILQERMLDFLTASQRRYSKDPDFAEPMRTICAGARDQVQNALQPFIKVRGAHVHEGRSRHSDPQLVRLSLLDLFTNQLMTDNLTEELEKASHEARQWLTQQVDYCAGLAWTLLDGICEILGQGIITDNGWLIVPTNYKSEP